MTSFKYIIYDVNDDGKFIPIGSKSLEEIKEFYKIEDNTYKFMTSELKDHGRYWLTDDKIIRAIRDS